MKKFKRIGAMILVVAMLCALSVNAFAAGEEKDAVVGTKVADSQIDITGAKVEKTGDVFNVTLSYTVTGEVESTDQITMLAYLFEKDGTLAESDDVGESDTVEDLANEPDTVKGYIRAIDQLPIVQGGATGTIPFALAIGDGANGAYHVSENSVLAVRLGSNAESVTKAQAFIIDLSQFIDEGILGDANGDDDVNGLDAVAVQEYDLYGNALNRIDLADVNGDDDVNGLDAVALQEYDLYGTAFPNAD
ncbi:MAG: dockerin type I repeat-containing protein [Clostridia bacterium]|nr:dockerin type I repeat-containing protein [Clostridia bacterium]